MPLFCRIIIEAFVSASELSLAASRGVAILCLCFPIIFQSISPEKRRTFSFGACVWRKKRENFQMCILITYYTVGGRRQKHRTMVLL